LERIYLGTKRIMSVRYAYITNGIIANVYDLLPDSWNNISNFPVLWATEPDVVRSMGWRTVQVPEIEYNSLTHTLSEPIYTIVDDEVVETRELIEVVVPEPIPTIPPTNQQTSATKQNRHGACMQIIRQERDRLLRDTDFTQLADVVTANGPELTEAYRVYRQQLRDLPSAYQDDIEFFDYRQIEYPSRPEI